jgi:hypothetical protein
LTVAAIGILTYLAFSSASSPEVANPVLEPNDDAPGPVVNLNRTRFTDPAVLIQNKNVQEHLDLNEKTREDVLQIPIFIRQILLADHKAIMEMADHTEREKKKQEVRKRTLAEGIKELKRRLTPDQFKRIQQLALQVCDFQAFEREDIKEALKLDSEQQKQLSGIGAVGKREMAAAVFDEKRSGGGNFEAMWEKSRPARKKAMAASVAVLNTDQKKLWNEMVGEPFDFALEKPGKDMLPREGGPPPATEAQKADPTWISKKIDEWKPTAKEKNFDQIGWHTSLIEATQLAKEHNRGVYIFVVDGVLGTGRC